MSLLTRFDTRNHQTFVLPTSLIPASSTIYPMRVFWFHETLCPDWKLSHINEPPTCAHQHNDCIKCIKDTKQDNSQDPRFKHYFEAVKDIGDYTSMSRQTMLHWAYITTMRLIETCRRGPGIGKLKMNEDFTLH